MTLHVVDEDDPCPGHMSVTGDHIDCDLPFGHRGVPQEPYDWKEGGL